MVKRLIISHRIFVMQDILSLSHAAVNCNKVIITPPTKRQALLRYSARPGCYSKFTADDNECAAERLRKIGH